MTLGDIEGRTNSNKKEIMFWRQRMSLRDVQIITRNK